MNTNKKDSFNKASVIIALSIILGTVAYAWTPAPANPPSNNVPAPINAGDNVQTKGGPVIFNGSFNPIRLSSTWTGYTLNGAGIGAVNNAEIANDTATYNALMIAGNKSGDNINRKVKMYDDVDVAQNLTAVNINATNKIYSVSTVDGDTATTVVTKDYVTSKISSATSTLATKSYVDNKVTADVPSGVLCGMYHTYTDPMSGGMTYDVNILCKGRQIVVDGCPSGYSLLHFTSTSDWYYCTKL